jgi:V/A-type H+/Na+-transporting ATPase subunit D
MQPKIESTKANLIRLKREAALARQGLEILDRKREILMRELSARVADYERKYTQMSVVLKSLYKRNADALASIGPRAAAYETIPIPGTLSIRAAEKRIMGVRIPTLKINEIDISSHPKSAELDTIAAGLASAIPDILSYIETVCAMRRIAREVLKTQKREKAIEEIHIPSYTREITRISAALDENEREELVRYKSLKRRLSS